MAAASARRAQAERTRERIVTAARHAFEAHGFEGTSIATLLREAGLARGGLYHHFPSKRALFEAAVHEAEGELLAWMSAAQRLPGGPWTVLRAACGLYLSAFTDPGFARLLLRETPAVLGEDAGHEHVAAVFAHHLEQALEEDPAQAQLLAPLLLGALRAGAAAVASADTDTARWRGLHRSVTFLLEGLRLTHQQGVLPKPSPRADWEENPWQAWRQRAAPTPKSSATSPASATRT